MTTEGKAVVTEELLGALGAVVETERTLERNRGTAGASAFISLGFALDHLERASFYLARATGESIFESAEVPQ